MFIYAPPDSFDPEKHLKDIPLGQGAFFRRWKKAGGQRVVTLAADSAENRTTAYIQCVEYVLPVVGSVWVAARGPVGSFPSLAIEEKFYAELRRLCREASPKTSHIRIQHGPTSRFIRTVPAEYTPGAFNHPSCERILSLERDMAAIRADFAGNTARIVKRHERDPNGVHFHVEKTNFNKYAGDVYMLLEATASRAGFSLHPSQYYEALFDEMAHNPEYATLVLGYGSADPQPVSFVLMLYSGREAYHLLAGNAEAGYDLNMPTLTLYTAIQEAKKEGVLRYNMGAVYAGTRLSLRSLRNQSLFKGKFGGEAVDHGHPRDIVISGWRYALYRCMRWYPVHIARRYAVRLYQAILVEFREGA